MKAQIILTILATSMFNVACSQNLPDAVNNNLATNSSTAASSPGSLTTVTLPTTTTTTTATVGTGLTDSTGAQIVSGSAYYIKNLATGNCLDVTGAGTTDGTRVQPYACNAGSTNQQWAVLMNSDGTFSLVGVGSQDPMNLDTMRIPAADGIVQIYSVANGGMQSFMITASNGGYSLVNTLSPTQSIQDTGSHIFAETTNNATNQAFTFVPANSTAP